MRIVRTISELRALLKAQREENRRVGFVPTMGYLHDGHAALIKQSVSRCDTTVVSIFVNPTQFGANEDLGRYPKDIERDQALCLKLGASVLFLPETSEVYPTGFNTFIDPGELGESLCGKHRPGHFRGVATIVAKLFNMVQPDLAFFGQKDLQQTVVLRRMVRDLNMPVDIVVSPTVREADGLALSSRNTYLSSEERQRALSLSRALHAAEKEFQQGERNAAKLLTLAQSHLKEVDEIQYLELVDAHNLEKVDHEVTKTSAIAVAAMVGKTRLIDNVLLTPDPEAAQFISHLE